MAVETSLVVRKTWRLPSGLVRGVHNRISGVEKYSETRICFASSQSVELAGHYSAADKNGSGELDGAAFITIELPDDPDEPFEGCGAADRPCVLAFECNERPARALESKNVCRH